MVEWSLPEERERLTKKQWTDLFLAQNGCCKNCNQTLVVKGANEVWIIDEHLVPLSMGGSNAMPNRQLWCRPCSGKKTSDEAPVRAKSNRVRAKHIGTPKKSKWRPRPKDCKFDWKLGRYVKNGRDKNSED